MNSGFFKWVADVINGDNKNTKEENVKKQDNKPIVNNNASQPQEGVVKEAKSAEEVKPAEDIKPTEEAKPAEDIKPTEEAKPAEDIKPTEEAKPAEDIKPAEEAKPVQEPTQPEGSVINEAKSTEEVKPVTPQIINKENIEKSVTPEAASNNNNHTPIEEPLERLDNGIKRRDDFIVNTINTIRAYYKGTHPNFSDKLLRLWITDVLFFDTINNQSFIDELAVKLNNETGYTFGKIDLKSGPLPPSHTFTPINSYAHLELLLISQVKRRMRAVIRVVEGYGSTIHEEYILDSEEIQKRVNERYNIGIGVNPRIDNIMHRDNYIAIDDNINSPQFHNNKYVSRSHAHIEYSDEHGFQLFVDKGGTSLANKRTQLQRNMEIIPIDNVLIPITLKDGDYIILSKHVSLMYNEINI